LMEGLSQESIALAGHLKLNRLIVLWDDNGISIDGPLSIADSVDQLKRFDAAGWATARVDGHDPDAIAKAIEAAQKADRPTLIACKTIIGYGAPNRAGTSKAHGEPLGGDELKAAKEKLGLLADAFAVPGEVLSAWRAIGQRSAALRANWQNNLSALDAAKRAEFERRMAGKLPDALAPAIDALKAKLVAEPQTIATRKASEVALEAITAAVPELILGSADLTPSNNTKTKNLAVLKAGEYGGRYIHYGIREHGMAAAMNGMALHGGVIPAGATFMVFTDYCRPAIRLSALMGVRVIYVMTHDSIGLGEDGPTHQPVEHLAALRAIPNLDVFRPADPVETAECWQLALENSQKPTVLALTRQNLAPFRKTDSKANLCAQGAYELSPAQGKAKVSLFASGSEVEIAMAAQVQLAEKGIAARVVSVPSLTRLLALSDAERNAIIGDAAVNIAIEAGIRMGWDQVIGPKGAFIGMNSFGASAPYKELYTQFGITADNAVKEAMARL